MLDQLVEFFERTGVEKEFDALASRQLAFAMLAFAALGAAAFIGRGVAATHFLEAIHELKDNIGLY